MPARIEPLAGRHRREGFDCGEPALSEFLVRLAGQQQRRGIGKTYVALAADGETVIGCLVTILLTGEEHFGFLANSCRATRLETIRAALAAPPPAATPAEEPAVPFDGYPCPRCGTGRLRIIAHLAPHRRDDG